MNMLLTTVTTYEHVAYDCCSGSPLSDAVVVVVVVVVVVEQTVGLISSKTLALVLI